MRVRLWIAVGLTAALALIATGCLLEEASPGPAATSAPAAIPSETPPPATTPNPTAPLSATPTLTAATVPATTLAETATPTPGTVLSATATPEPAGSLTVAPTPVDTPVPVAAAGLGSALLPASTPSESSISKSAAKRRTNVIPGIYCPAGETPASTFTGTGDSLTSAFALTRGIVVLKAKYAGSGEFVVLLKGEESGYLTASNGSRYASILADSPFDGTVVDTVHEGNPMGFSPGRFRLDVEADGRWAIAVSQPVCQEGTRLQFAAEASGHKVYAPVLVTEGLYLLLATFDGAGYFLFGLDAADGERREYLAGDTSGGGYSGSVEISVGAEGSLLPGVHVMWAKGQGAWTLELQGPIEPEKSRIMK